jgi:hypothetical protein
MESNKKAVWFIRHGEAEHNKTKNNQIRDPALTEFGVTQAKDAASSPAFTTFLSQFSPSNPLLVVVSPLRRTLQTACALFEDTMDRVQFLVLADAQEIGGSPCDQGRCVSELQSEFPQLSLGMAGVEDTWFNKVSPWSDNQPIELGQQMLRERIQRLTQLVCFFFFFFLDSFCFAPHFFFNLLVISLIKFKFLITLRYVHPHLSLLHCSLLLDPRVQSWLLHTTA